MTTAGVSIGVLGTTALSIDGRPHRLRAAKQRALLALLAMWSGERIATEVLVDVLWGEAAPSSAATTLRGYVADLRRTLEPGRSRRAEPRVLVTEPGGYTLCLAPEALDSRRLADAVRVSSAKQQELVGEDPWRPRVARGLRGEAEQVVARLDDALALWRSDPLTDLGCHPDVDVERERLRSLRLQAQVLRSTVLVGLQQHATALVDLEALCRTHPWHEHLWALRSLALAGCGRQVEALAHLRLLRGALAEQLGIDPDPQIARLELDLIRQELPAPAVDVAVPVVMG